MVFGVWMTSIFYHSCLVLLNLSVSTLSNLPGYRHETYQSTVPILDHKYIRPKSIHDLDIVEQFSKSYMYLGCIDLINSVKTTASLRWHSPMLDDISAAKSWAKVNAGMIKMYKAEVLNKLPIMQHFMFGGLIKFEGGSHIQDDDDGCGHHHHHPVKGDGDVYAMGQEHPDCCGIPIPSAIAAAAASQNRRPIPFD